MNVGGFIDWLNFKLFNWTKKCQIINFNWMVQSPLFLQYPKKYKVSPSKNTKKEEVMKHNKQLENELHSFLEFYYQNKNQNSKFSKKPRIEQKVFINLIINVLLVSKIKGIEQG